MKPAICIEWQTRTMPTPAYWYYAPDAHLLINRTVASFAGRVPLVVRCCEVPDLAPLLEERRGLEP